MNVRCKVAYCRANPPIECTPIREMPTKAHSSRAYLSVACAEREKGGNREGSVFVVSRYFLRHISEGALDMANAIAGI